MPWQIFSNHKNSLLMANILTDGFSEGDDEQVVNILKKWRGGVLSDQLFTVLAGMLPQPTVETVVLRKNGSEIEALLIPRPVGDIIWPGMVHTPGQALRAQDFHRPDNIPMNGPFERVQKYEIMTEFSKSPEFVGVAQYQTARGPEAVHVYLGLVAENARLPAASRWCNIKELEKLDNFIRHQLVPVRMAAEYFKSHYD
jgi:hypothetical protein